MLWNYIAQVAVVGMTTNETGSGTLAAIHIRSHTFDTGCLLIKGEVIRNEALVLLVALTRRCVLRSQTYVAKGSSIVGMTWNGTLNRN